MDESTKGILDKVFMNPCIICGCDAGFRMVCDGCKEAIIHYKKELEAKKAEEIRREPIAFVGLFYALLQGNRVIDQYMTSGINSVDEIVEELKKKLNEDLNGDNFEWLCGCDGRMERFMTYLRNEVEAVLKRRGL